MEDGLPVSHLQWSEVCFDAVLSSDSIVDDLDVQLSHPTQNGLEDGEWQNISVHILCADAPSWTKSQLIR